MGFGILCIGYLIAFFPSVSVAVRYPCYLLGFFLLAWAISKLREYKQTYGYALIPLLLLILLSGYGTLCMIAPALSLGVIFPEGLAGQAMVALLQILILILQEILLFSTAKMAVSVGLTKKRDSAVRNMVWVGLYFLFAVIQMTGVFDGFPYIGLVHILVYLFTVGCCLSLYVSCYMRICPEEDAKMERKPSRFAFVNRFRQEFDRRQEKATDESVADYVERKRKKKGRK